MSAKLVHYVVTYFIGAHHSENRRKRQERVNARVGKLAFLALFTVAATPIPDELVIVPLGLMKYNPAKFSLAIFLGKICIAIPGACLGQIDTGLISSTLSQVAHIIVLAVLTIIMKIVLIKIDVEDRQQNHPEGF